MTGEHHLMFIATAKPKEFSMKSVRKGGSRLVEADTRLEFVMKRCPHCNKQLKVPNYAWHNADAYDQRVNVTTECCDKMITITPIRTYNVSKYEGTATEDDWGVPPGENHENSILS